MNRCMLFCLAVVLMVLPGIVFALPAFPGAEGFGSQTVGGRGGRVLEVTNLNDSGPGSLRAACEADGPRIVVFRVGGTIRLKKHLEITKPFITMAGQTSPGEGILLRDAGLHIFTHDVVVRYLRVRIGESRVEKADSQDPLHLGAGDKNAVSYNIVIDHCSFGWGIDEVGDSWGNVRDFTIQWCILSEALKNSIHNKGEHSMCLLLGRKSTNSSIHHNLLAHSNSRNPRIQGGRRDFVNNLIYNWGSIAGMFSNEPEVNFVANYYKPGPNSGARDHFIIGDGLGKIYIRDNVFPGTKKPDWDYIQPGKGAAHAEKRFYAPHVTVIPTSELPDQILANAGCILPARDTVDRRVVREVREGTGSLIDSPEQVGGFPEITGGAAPSDRDHDGMPDNWENPHGLNPDDPTDAAKDRDGDGYTNVEEYLNGIG